METASVEMRLAWIKDQLQRDADDGGE